jgi:hypothetical protein
VTDHAKPVTDELPETRLVPQGNVSDAVAAAAKEVADAGGCPRAQIDAARAVLRQTGGNKEARKLQYVSHQGKRQRARELERIAKAQAKGRAE